MDLTSKLPANLLRNGRALFNRPAPFEVLTLSKREAGVYREIKPAPDRPPTKDTIAGFLKGWFKSEFSTAVHRVQTYWSSSVNVMGPNLRFAAEMMNPVIAAVTQMPSAIFGKPPDPMARMASLMNEVIIGRQQHPQGINLGR